MNLKGCRRKCLWPDLRHLPVETEKNRVNLRITGFWTKI
jgi:hypothetical protein